MSCYMMKWNTCAQRVNKTNTELTTKRDIVTQVHISQQQSIKDGKHIHTDQRKRTEAKQGDKHIHTDQRKRTEAKQGDKHIHTDLSKRIKVNTIRYTHTQRSKQKNKCTHKTINTYTQIKTKEQRHTQGNKHIHTDENKGIKANTRR